MPKASISVDFDRKILPEATFFKLEHSNLTMFISIMPLKTYFNEKFHFGDFDFLAFLSGQAYLRPLGALPILGQISNENYFWASLTILHMCPNELFDQMIL